MSKFIVRIIPIIYLLIGCVLAWSEMNGPPRQGENMKPPQEAIDACKGKNEGDSVQFTTPRGDTLKGVCKQIEGVLVAVPKLGKFPPKDNKPDESK